MSNNFNGCEVLGVQHDATPDQIIHARRGKEEGIKLDENLQDSPQVSNAKEDLNVALDAVMEPKKGSKYDLSLQALTGGNDRVGQRSEEAPFSQEDIIEIENDEKSEKGKAVSVEETPRKAPQPLIISRNERMAVGDAVDEAMTSPAHAPGAITNEAEIVPAPEETPIQSSEIRPADESIQTVSDGRPCNLSATTGIEESKQWFDAIQERDCDKLMELISEDASYLWKYEKGDVTAMEIATKCDVRHVYRILDELLKLKQKNSSCLFFQLLNHASEFDSVFDYIQKSLRNHQSDSLEERRRRFSKELFSRPIEQKDWATLQNLFCKSSGVIEYMNYFWSERSVLHVAAMYGCLPLVELLTAGIKHCERDTALNFISAVDPETGLTALQMADEIIGNRSVSECIKCTVEVLESSRYLDRSSYVKQGVRLFEAYPHTQWYKELKAYITESERKFMACSYSGLQSTRLRESLGQNSHLLLQAYHGLSALSLAIVYTDGSLVGYIKGLFGPQRRMKWGDSYYPGELSWEEMLLAEGHDGIEFNRKSFSEFNFNSLPYYKSSAQRIADICSFPLKDVTTEIEITSFLPEHSLEFSAMNKYIDQEWNGSYRQMWQEGFEADVDFNFETEPRKSLLRVHHACKHPLRFQEFLKSVSNHESFNDFSTQLYDAKGRTLHHILLDHHTGNKLPGWAFTEIFPPEVSKFCFKYAQDSRGRRLMDVLVVKNCLQHNITLRPYSYFNMKFEHDVAGKDVYITFFGNYYIASALHQTLIASQPFWVDVLQANPADLKTLQQLPFATVVATNQTMLQAISREEPQIDLIVPDEKKRTLLHYAADPTLLDFKNLMHMASKVERSMIYNCFSTVEDYCEFRKKPFSKTDTGINSQDPSPWADDEKEEIVQLNARRRACILMLLQAGLDLSQQDNDRKVPSLGPTSDVSYQTWWYDMVVKDATDNKSSINQAGNALSVVGTLVAATSYIGPLQPPMTYSDNGLVRHSEKLVEVFMITNTLAFFLAVASVMFAVVPSLPMPRESVMSELKRARHMVSLSLCLLLVAIVALIVSFSAASVVVYQYEHSFPRSNKLLGPLLVGWAICFIAVASFFIRILRLSFYENAVVQIMYQFSVTRFCTRTYPNFLVQDFERFGSSMMRCLADPLMDMVDQIEPCSDNYFFVVIIVLVFVFGVVNIVFILLLFPFYHVFHVFVLLPGRKTIEHCARFLKRQRLGDRN